MTAAADPERPSQADPAMAARGRPPRTSALVRQLADEWSEPSISLGDIMHKLRDRSFGVLMILFAMPNAVIPGVSAILGTPIIIFAAQMIFGLREPWLPELLTKRSMPTSQFRAIAYRVVRFLEWLERLLKPRFTFMTGPSAERFLGVYLFLVAIVLAMPIPYGNPLPAFSISFIAAGLMEEDGLAVAAGLLLGVAGTIYVIAAIGGVIYAVGALWTWLGF